MVNCNENEFQHFKIRSLSEISKLQLLFCQQIPLINKFDNNYNNQQNQQEQQQEQQNQNQIDDDNYINNNYNNDGESFSSIKEIIKKIIIDGNGGNSSHLNIVFGLFLNEIGIKVQLVKTVLNSNGIIHFSNIIQWKDGNDYFVDVGLNVNSCFQPIELLINNTNSNSNSNSIVNFNQKEYRVRRLIDGSFIYEQKQNNQSIFQAICHFNRNLILSNDQLISILNCKYLSSSIQSTSSSSSSSSLSIPPISLFKLFDKGYYLFENDCFYIIYFNNSKKDREIQLKDFTSLLSTTPSAYNYVNLENNYNTKQFLNKYFNILI
ncbi:hypothetical protein DDB_G0291073 [Dictyostelium discoideum AX4]|uniref:Uncharacterized protein n=1 Tax=Dictyostelium discoideum TaxID=44689 RepID=Q54F67_DICDI|nr:hypothetical protein DDB_G0291073 [Dictyostelium discoideum AX4]EAL61908.1 hypothetical protein DDB_G0291073 [Dictyostelium discoideum AX4]|eukprot:XP_635411.1 hypothetical protein DDB_G0291073 [Dictyostelium discoideum AX4]